MSADPVGTVQAAVVAAINTLGTALIGSEFTWIKTSPIPDAEIAKILAGLPRQIPEETK